MRQKAIITDEDRAAFVAHCVPTKLVTICRKCKQLTVLVDEFGKTNKKCTHCGTVHAPRTLSWAQDNKPKTIKGVRKYANARG